MVGFLLDILRRRWEMGCLLNGDIYIARSLVQQSHIMELREIQQRDNPSNFTTSETQRGISPPHIHTPQCISIIQYNSPFPPYQNFQPPLLAFFVFSSSTLSCSSFAILRSSLFRCASTSFSAFLRSIISTARFMCARSRLRLYRQNS
jgi:hypothetical protein